MGNWESWAICNRDELNSKSGRYVVIKDEHSPSEDARTNVILINAFPATMVASWQTNEETNTGEKNQVLTYDQQSHFQQQTNP
jgi:hypothetical protein